MNLKKYFLYIPVIFILFIFAAFFLQKEKLEIKNYDEKLIEKEMFTGEEITYVVKYSFMKLGEVKLQILNKVTNNGDTLYKTRAYIDSYEDIPFVSLHQIYESDFHKDQYSVRFRQTEKEKDYTKFTDYNFNYDKNLIHVKKGKLNPFQMWTDSTTNTKNKFYQDGLSLFYYARLNTGQKKTVNVPCFITEKYENTKINFYDKVEPISLENVNYKIAAVRLDGYTDFVSIFGLTGNFEGWFTNDAHAVPVIAKMKVIIGNVTLELKEWRKGDWKLPKY